MAFQLLKIPGVTDMVLTVKGKTGEAGETGYAGASPNCFQLDDNGNLEPAVVISAIVLFDYNGDGDLEPEVAY